MIIYHLKDLMLKKSIKMNKKITYKTISEDTGISVVTLSRIASKKGYKISMDNMEKLCKYFKCNPDQFMSIIHET